jgi:hypothetical protein
MRNKKLTVEFINDREDRPEPAPTRFYELLGKQGILNN